MSGPNQGYKRHLDFATHGLVKQQQEFKDLGLIDTNLEPYMHQNCEQTRQLTHVSTRDVPKKMPEHNVVPIQPN